MAYSPLFSIVLAGVGNALFHVGGGSISLNLTPKKAAAPGIYVAPGALGVTAGVLIGTGGFVAWPFILLLAVACAIIIKVKPPAVDYNQQKAAPGGRHYELVIVLVLLAVMVRSLIGMVVVFPWKTDYSLLMLLTFGVVAGKALGGIIGDRFGWLPVAVATLVLSAPLLAYGSGTPFLAIIGMFLFQATMPITLTAVSNMLPGRPGFAFGLTCLALIIGALPAFTELKTFYSSELLTLSTILITAAALYIALRLYSKNLEQWIG